MAMEAAAPMTGRSAAPAPPPPPKAPYDIKNFYHGGTSTCMGAVDGTDKGLNKAAGVIAGAAGVIGGKRMDNLMSTPLWLPSASRGGW